MDFHGLNGSLKNLWKTKKPSPPQKKKLKHVKSSSAKKNNIRLSLAPFFRHLMYMKPNYWSLLAAYWNKQGLLILSHINSPWDIIYFPLPFLKDLKRGGEGFFCTARQKTLSRIAAKTIQQRKSNLKPSLFYSNKRMHNCLLFHKQISQERKQLWLCTTPSTRAGSRLLPGSLHAPSSSNPGSKHREESQVRYRAEESQIPTAGEKTSKRNQALQPMEQKPMQRGGGDKQRDSECW